MDKKMVEGKVLLGDGKEKKGAAVRPRAARFT
jgi:hypothetical protein